MVPGTSTILVDSLYLLVPGTVLIIHSGTIPVVNNNDDDDDDDVVKRKNDSKVAKDINIDLHLHDVPHISSILCTQ